MMKLAVSTTLLLSLLSGTNGASSITRKRRATYIVSNPVVKGQVSEDKQMFAYIESNPVEGALPEDKQIFGALGDMKGSVPTTEAPVTTKKPKDDDDDDCKGGKGCDDDDDDDDDFVDYRSSRTINITCEIDGKNYLRCDPDTVAENDVSTCDEIENEICGEGMDKDNEYLCECLFGPYEKGMPQLRGAVSV